MEFLEGETKECEQRNSLLTAMFQEDKSESKLYKLNLSGEQVPLYRVQCQVLRAVTTWLTTAMARKEYVLLNCLGIVFE